MTAETLEKAQKLKYQKIDPLSWNMRHFEVWVKNLQRLDELSLITKGNGFKCEINIPFNHAIKKHFAGFVKVLHQENKRMLKQLEKEFAEL